MTTIVSGSSITFNDNTTQNTSAYGGGFAMRNRIINGDCRIDQRNAGASVTPANGAYTLDRWGVYQFSSASKFSVQQSSTAPTGFNNSLIVTSLSAYSVAVGDIYGIYQRIEGFNVADLGWGTANAQTVTLSFWVRSSLTGTFGGAFQNDAGDRAYPFTYTISSANTWEQKTITVAGDTTGTWLKTNGDGLQITFGLGVGSNRSATAGSWQAGNFGSATGATSVVGTNGATFYITGVQLEKGSTATSFDYRPYGTELALCQRYYIEYPASTVPTGYQDGTTNVVGTLNTPVTLRATPTMTYGAGTTYALIEGLYKTSNSTSLSGINFYGANQVQFKLGGFTGLNDLRIANLLPPGKITISSEL
jgi:hypothetical protein